MIDFVVCFLSWYNYFHFPRYNHFHFPRYNHFHFLRYNHCFEPMVPPPITWSELLPSLTVYSWVKTHNLKESILIREGFGVMDGYQSIYFNKPMLFKYRYESWKITTFVWWLCSLYWKGNIYFEKELELRNVCTFIKLNASFSSQNDQLIVTSNKWY